jgi:hypothetical protein
MVGKMKSAVNNELEELSKKIMVELEKGSTEASKALHLVDVRKAKKLLEVMDKASTKSERDSGKRALVEDMVVTTWLQRLYFVIRSFIMGLISLGISGVFILYFGSINVTLGIVLGIVSFVLSLVISRLFDTQIVSITTRIVSFLNGHKALRNFIISHF